MLTKNQFEVLNVLRTTPNASQRDIAAASDISLGTVNTALKALIAEGLVENGGVTAAGKDALAPTR